MDAAGAPSHPTGDGLVPPPDAQEQVPRLVDKESALGLARLSVGSIFIGVLIGIGIPAARFLLPPSAWEPVMTAVFFLMLPFAGVGLWAGVELGAAMRREREGGYTTLYSVYRELWQLHPKTGEVLRRPGEREVRRRAR